MRYLFTTIIILALVYGLSQLDIELPKQTKTIHLSPQSKKAIVKHFKKHWIALAF
jgi:hypothetical protein